MVKRRKMWPNLGRAQRIGIAYLLHVWIKCILQCMLPTCMCIYIFKVLRAMQKVRTFFSIAPIKCKIINKIPMIVNLIQSTLDMHNLRQNNNINLYFIPRFILLTFSTFPEISESFNWNQPWTVQIIWYWTLTSTYNYQIFSLFF